MSVSDRFRSKAPAPHEGGGPSRRTALGPRVRGGAGGFSLLEVVVALAVIALILVGLSKSAGQSARALEIERDDLLAQWVASDVLAETRLAEHFPAVGKREGSLLMGQREYRWELVVASTQEPAVRRMDVRVFLDRDSDRDRPLYTLVGFAGQ